MSEEQDLFERWKGEVQRLRDAHEAEMGEVARTLGVRVEDIRSGAYKRRVRREAQEQTHGQGQGDWRNWRGAARPSDRLESVRERLEQMHVHGGPSKFRHGCWVCEALDEIDSV